MGVLTRAVRNVSRRKIRASLVIIALSLSVAILVTIPSGIMANQKAAEQLSSNYDNYLEQMESEITTASTLLEVSLSSGFSGQGFGGRERPEGQFPNGEPPEGGAGMGGFIRDFMSSESFFNESAVANISSIEGIAAVIPILEKSEGTVVTQTTQFGEFDVIQPEYTVVGVPLDDFLLSNYPILPSDIVEGRTLAEGDTDAVLLSQNNTEYFGVGLNDQVNILGTDFTVVGIYSTTVTQEMDHLYMSLPEAQLITETQGNISRIDVYAENEDVIDEIQTAITEMYPEFSVSTAESRLEAINAMAERQIELLDNAEANLAETQAVAYMEIGIAVVATSLIVLFTMLYTVRERTHEIGVLKAIGFSNGNIMNQFMLEGMVLSIVAGLAGVAIGLVGAPVLTQLLITGFSSSSSGLQMVGVTGRAGGDITGVTLQNSIAAPTAELLLIVFAGAVLLGVVGSLYPAWRASKTSPMEALKRE